MFGVRLSVTTSLAIMNAIMQVHGSAVDLTEKRQTGIPGQVVACGPTMFSIFTGISDLASSGNDNKVTGFTRPDPEPPRCNGSLQFLLAAIDVFRKQASGMPASERVEFFAIIKLITLTESRTAAQGSLTVNVSTALTVGTFKTAYSGHLELIEAGTL
ncbi:hypothetical protein B0H13DRAFT_1862254 [Mycena leptocephala]|nr:hypothetical protein B0H13DRAFT_1862254 [Mycena leptocephala]